MVTDYDTRLQMANKQIDDAVDELQSELQRFIEDRALREPDNDDWDDTLLCVASRLRYTVVSMKHARAGLEEGS